MSFVDVFFTLLNFAILVGGLFYTFKKWILPRIQEELQQEQSLEESLLIQHDKLDQKLLAIEREQDEREQWYQDLAHKVVVWKDAVQRETNFAQEEALRNARLIQLRSEQQVLLRTMQRVQARVIPHAVAQARLELYDRYQLSDEGNAFINDIIKDMREQHGCSK